MVDILVPGTIADYDLSKPPGLDNPTAGMGVKYARVEDALRRRYPNARRVTHLEDVSAEVVMVDPLWFRNAAHDNRLRIADEFVQKGFNRSILYASDHYLMTMPDELRRKIIPNVTWVTHNSDYQRNAFRSRGIYHSEYLCDPIPDVFAPTTKVPRVYTASQVNWSKRIDDLIEIYEILHPTHVETVFVGSATMWGHTGSGAESSQRYRLQDALKEVCDVFLGNGPETEVAQWANASMHHLLVSQHDCSSQNQEEAGLSGCVLWGTGHPLNRERPVFQCSRPRDIAEAILEMDEAECVARSAQVREYAYTHWSYDAFLNQLENLVRGR